MSLENQLYALAERVGMALMERGHNLAAAESCTGGWICQTLTDVAGSSAWFDRGFVTYTNEAKQELLGVPESVLDEHGAVSEETVRAMAAGALRNSRSNWALAVSGIAGPTGATPGKPIGTVWFAWQMRGGGCVTRGKQFEGDRRSVRRQAVAEALNGLLELYGLPRFDISSHGSSVAARSGARGNAATINKTRQRLFFALWPEEPAREELISALRLLQSSVTARWIRPENLHMTLAFLGDVEAGRLPSVKAAADGVYARSFELALDRIEHWRKPQVICLSPAETPRMLHQLAADLAANLRAEGFESDNRPFLAHLTLARKAPYPPPETRLERPILWKSKAFALVESRQNSEGSHYTILQSWTLK